MGSRPGGGGGGPGWIPRRRRRRPESSKPWSRSRGRLAGTGWATAGGVSVPWARAGAPRAPSPRSRPLVCKHAPSTSRGPAPSPGAGRGGGASALQVRARGGACVRGLGRGKDTVPRGLEDSGHSKAELTLWDRIPEAQTAPPQIPFLRGSVRLLLLAHLLPLQHLHLQCHPRHWAPPSQSSVLPWGPLVCPLRLPQDSPGLSAALRSTPQCRSLGVGLAPLKM